jgi:hypothetical protein
LFKAVDTLLLFLILSICSLYAFVDDINYFTGLGSQNHFKTFIKAENVYKVPRQGLIRGPVYVKNYNSNFEIFVSTNGGDSYSKIDETTNLLDLKFENLSNYQMSIRQKPKMDVCFDKDVISVKSFLIKARHKYKSIFCQPKCFTYVVNYQSNIPIVNLVCSQRSLVDEQEGIMVFGRNSWFDSDFYKEFWYRNANYKQKGNFWRKKTYLQIIENDLLQYETITGLQISGHATRSFPQKSLKLKTDKRFNANKITYPFFADQELHKYNSLVLRISGNDNTKTLFADLLMHNLVENTNVITQKGKPVNVFINGNYWGVYNVREKPDAYFLAQKEKCKTKEITILENSLGTLEKGSKKQQKQYLKFIDSISNLNTINAIVLNRVKEVIDVNSFTDYIIIETFYGNSDWLHNNTKWYKAKHQKWKWILIDLDYGLAYTGENNIKKNYFNNLQSSNSITAQLFKTLIKNSLFKSEFKIRAHNIMQTNFNKNNVIEKYNKLKKQYETNIKYHINRWRHSFTYQQWEKNCKANLDFLLKRPQYFLKQVNEL